MITLLAAAGALLAGCNQPASSVPVPLPSASPAGCARMSAALPDALLRLSRRPTTPRDPRVAAYGDPPVTIRCGVPVPASYMPTATLVAVNGIGWYEQIDTTVVRWTTPKLFVLVEVAIPKDYPDHGSMLAQLTAAVRAAQ